MDRLQIMFVAVFCFVSVIQLSGAQLTNTLSDEEGASVTLECAVLGSYTFPEWRGPPSLTIYTNAGSGTINPTLSTASKFSYAGNNKDLVLTDAAVSDSGEYRCSVAGTGDNTITLTITEAKETTTPGGLSVGAKVGIAVGVVAFIATVTIVGILIWKKVLNNNG